MQMCSRCGLHAPQYPSTICETCAVEVQQPNGDELLAARAPHLNQGE